MKFSLWEKIAKDIYSYFGRKEPEPDQITLWFDIVKHVPDFIAEGVKKDLFKLNDGLPRNMPKAFATAWQQWQAGNPHKMAKVESQDCEPCQGGGLLVTEQIINGYQYQITYRCGNCTNWHRHFSPQLEDNTPPLRVTREWLESQKYKIVHPNLERIRQTVRQPSDQAKEYIKQAVNA